MRQLLFLSIISALFAPGCSDDTCGPGGASANGLVASSADVTLTYGNLTSSDNNDCRDSTAPTVISLTIEGTQTDSTSLITLCIPRPDQLATMDQQLGTGLRIIDFNGEKDGCMYALEASRPVTGTVHAIGMCDNGKNAAGYALAFDGNLSLRRTCPTTTDTIALALQGTVAVKLR